ncbi:MAG: hypothetical protein EXR71_11670 [Myxococcales bacterium]|nr:hypothetical protein [Myxococcales bacterium]
MVATPPRFGRRFGRGATLLAGLCAVLGPALVLGGGAKTLTTIEPWTPSLHVLAQNAEVQKKNPELVALGSSFCVTNTNAAQLAAGLGEPDLRISVLGEPGSASAMWYAILKDRVYRNGARPRLVVLVATMGTMMQGRVPTDRVSVLAELSAEVDEPLAQKGGLPSAADPWRLAMAQRGQLRDGWVAATRRLFVSFGFGGDGETLSTAAADAVFAVQQANGMEVPVRLLPGVEVGEDAEVRLATGLDDPALTFLPDLVALAHANGSEIAVVLPPVSPAKPYGQRLSPAGEAAVVQYLHDQDVGFVDLRDLSFPARYYRDGRHLSPKGAAVFSLAAGEALADIGALGANIRGPHIPPTVTRVAGPRPKQLTVGRTAQHGCVHKATYPRLPPVTTQELFAAGANAASPLVAVLGDTPLTPADTRAQLAGCTGTWAMVGKSLTVSAPTPDAPEPALQLAADAVLRGGRAASHWVYPGGALVWRWAEAPEPGRLRIRVHARSFGAEPPDTTLVIDGRPVALTPTGTGRWEAEAEALGGGPLSIEVRAGAGSAFMLVDELTLDAGNAPIWAVRPAPAHVSAVFSEAPAYAAPPPVPEAVDLGPLGKGGRFQVPFVNTVGCTAYEVTENGVALPVVVADAVPKHRPGLLRTHHHENLVWYATSDGTEPGANGRAYVLRFRDSRRCDQQQWLLPGDRLTAELGPRQHRSLSGPPRALELSGQSNDPSPPTGNYAVRVSRGDDVLFEGDVAIASVLAGTSLPLPAPTTGAVARTLRIDVRVPPDASPVLLDAGISDRARE